MYKAYRARQDNMAGRLNIGLLLSSTRENRLCDNVANFLKKAVEKDHNVTVFDPRDMDLPATQQSMNFLFDPSASKVPQNIKDLNEQMKTMDAFIMVCAEYNFSIPPALLNMLDNIPPTTLTWKPLSIVTYSIGPVGGWRAGMQVRQFAGGIGFICTQKQMGIGCAQNALNADGTCTNEQLPGELEKLLAQLYWMTNAFKTQTAKSPPPPFSL